MAAKFFVQVSDDADYKDAVLDAPRGTLCVVDVYASWCGPCDALNKKITNLYQDNTECAADMDYEHASIWHRINS